MFVRRAAARRRQGVSLALVVTCCATAAGCARSSTGPDIPASVGEQAFPVPSDLQGGVSRASAIGARLFVLDTATALAWEALRPARASRAAPRLGHYLALAGSDHRGAADGSVHVLFFTDEHVPRLAYRVRVVAGLRARSEVLVQDPPGVVHEPLMTLLNARQLALEALPSGEQALTPVLLPERGAIAVYLMGASSQPNTAVLGRHFRVEISPDGTEVEAIHALATAILEVPTEDGSGRRRASLAVIADGTDHPTEAHVFASRRANVPIYVTTARGRWRVRAAGIDYLGAP